MTMRVSAKALCLLHPGEQHCSAQRYPADHQASARSRRRALVGAACGYGLDALLRPVCAAAASVDRLLPSHALAAVAAPAAADASAAAEASATPAALRLGRAADEFLLMRHADAPGFSDPDNFRLDDCATQRNLGEQGRRQAQALGRWFQTQGLLNVEVWASPWCRCIDTARLLGLGEPQQKAFLGSFFRARDKADDHTRRLREALAQRLAARASKPLIAVTHQVNISAYTGVSVGSGEVLRVRIQSDGNPRATERLETG